MNGSREMSSGLVARILAVHQGYELYGSDRTFVSSLLGLRNAYPNAEILVLLPREGDLSALLRQEGFNVEVRSLWILRKATGIFGNLKDLAILPLRVWRALREINTSSFCYINTSVIFDYNIAARLAVRPCFLHVHEIPSGVALTIIGAFMKFSRSALIFNSDTTRKAFGMGESETRRLLLNGVPLPARLDQRACFSAGDGRIRLLMIGRINNWKGQDLLLQALARLPEALASRLDVRFVGAAFENGPAEQATTDLADELNLKANVVFEGFVADPRDQYEWSDFIVVPSRKPEPFGLVAVEAMAYGRAVIAAGHGGLTEIVVDKETGLLFTPNDAAALAAAIEQICNDPGRAAAMGEAGRRRFLKHFVEQRYQDSLCAIVDAGVAAARGNG